MCSAWLAGVRPIADVLLLAPAGRVILVEYRGEDPGVPIKELHKMTERPGRLREIPARS